MLFFPYRTHTDRCRLGCRSPRLVLAHDHWVPILTVHVGCRLSLSRRGALPLRVDGF